MVSSFHLFSFLFPWPTDRSEYSGLDSVTHTSNVTEPISHRIINFHPSLSRCDFIGRGLGDSGYIDYVLTGTHLYSRIQISRLVVVITLIVGISTQEFSGREIALLVLRCPFASLTCGIFRNNTVTFNRATQPFVLATSLVRYWHHSVNHRRARKLCRISNDTCCTIIFLILKVPVELLTK